MDFRSASRRDFLEFFGRTAAAAVIAGSSISKLAALPSAVRSFKPLGEVMADDVVLSDGLKYQVLIKHKDAIGKGISFGTHSDFLAFVPSNTSKTEGYLWVNHEYTQPLFVSGFTGKDNSLKTKEQVVMEMNSVGGSIVKIKKTKQGWQIDKDSKDNKRVTALTELPFAWHEEIYGSKVGIGTLANCAGGFTPWGTILTCEENYDGFWGERNYETGELSEKGGLGWEQYFNHPPEHYGWVVEVDPKTGKGKKLVALGRCAHECATTFRTPSGRMVVYTGDDANDQCLYKFVSDKPDTLETGELFVANTEKGEWISLDINKSPILKSKFKTQTEVQIRLREAADLVGGSKLNRPEDIEIDPKTGRVLVSLTNNKAKGDYYGSILSIEEGSADKTGTTFKSSVFKAGGYETGFACPDNLAFDLEGNLWFTSDISGSSINTDKYKGFGNNGLFYVPMSGTEAGKVIKVASAPVDAEFTGPLFMPDGTLLLCVQHPGERSKSLTQLTSHWPEGGNAEPKSSVIAISFPKL